MKTIFIIIITSLLSQHSMPQSLGNITDVNNKIILIDSLKGTKLLIVVLPSQTDTALNNQLLRFQKTYSQKVKVIGLVNVQPGSPTKEFYASAYGEASRSGVIVSEGIAGTEKTDNERASMIQWMTTKSNSRQQDRYAVGAKFFLSEEGRVYAQLGKEIGLDDPIIKCLVNTKVPTARTHSSKTQNP
jgi:hypothetical protein